MSGSRKRNVEKALRKDLNFTDLNAGATAQRKKADHNGPETKIIQYSTEILVRAWSSMHEQKNLSVVMAPLRMAHFINIEALVKRKKLALKSWH